MGTLYEILENTITITAFVFVMMLVMEYVNILTRGAWLEKLAAGKWTQYIAAAILGALPGDLGSFLVVAMYGHGAVSIGPLLTALIVATGDSAYIMLAMMPGKAFILTGVLIIIGIPAGILADILLKKYISKKTHVCSSLNDAVQENCVCYPRGQIISQLKNSSLARATIILLLLILIFYNLSGKTGQNGWDWLRITILFTSCTALFITVTVPDHFLEEHLWKHIVLKHIPKVLLWTFGALSVVHLSIAYTGLEGIIRESNFMIGVAGLVGLMPASGPQLIFPAMYANGLMPASILLVNSIVQDCHASLPLLAYSWRDFIIIKLIKFAAGMSIGYILLSLGY